MDQLHPYIEAVRAVIFEYAGYKPSNGEIETEVVIDAERGHYEVVHVGWDGHRRVHGSVIHIGVKATRSGSSTTARLRASPWTPILA